MPTANALPITTRLEHATNTLAQFASECIEARIASATAARATLPGLSRFLAIGDRLHVLPRSGGPVTAEVTGSTGDETLLTLYWEATGLAAGAIARLPLIADTGSLAITDGWIGRVIDPLGRPLDGNGALPAARIRRPVRCLPPPAAQRARLGPPVALGVRAMDVFTGCREGQRMGLFAGAGVGKSTLLGMLARWAEFDVVVVGLVGERGREVRDFLEDDLGPDGRRRSLLVVATADATALMRREAVHAAMAAAEHFRDQGKRVLLLVDSLTRFCHAVREVSLSNGELPVARGYPPSVFAELASLLERAGPGLETAAGTMGSITAFFTVLVDGDDLTEPVADAVRGILDGHIILSRQIAERGRYPAIDIPRSLSRTATAAQSPERNAMLRVARQAMAEAEELDQLARLGLYQAGSNPASDHMMALNRALTDFLQQNTHTRLDPDEGFAGLATLLGIPPEA